jgi:nucleotide-binding universal stress UspA family protein
MTEPVTRRIVVGVDYSDSAVHAAAWAAQEASDRRLPLHLVHALELPASAGLVARSDYVEECRWAGEALLARVGGELRARFPYLETSTEVVELGAAEYLIELSRGSELVAVGTRGHGGFAGLLLGSVSLRLAAHASCTTVVVPGEQPSRSLNEIVVGVGPDEPDEAIEFAFASAAQLGADLRVIRAWERFLPRGRADDTSMDDARRTEEEAEVAELLKGACDRHPEVRASVIVIRGDAVPALIEASRGSRLLVVGAHRLRGPLSVGLGYAVQGLISHSATPVAVVPIPVPEGR